VKVKGEVSGKEEKETFRVERRKQSGGTWLERFEELTK